jgi:glutamine synthetase
VRGSIKTDEAAFHGSKRDNGFSQTFRHYCAAGHDRAKNKLEPPKLTVATSTKNKRARHIPGTLRDALDKLRKGKILKQAFGKEVVDHYLHTGEWEQMEYDRRVTDWEIKRGFEQA